MEISIDRKNETAPEITGLDHIGIRVSERRRSIEFYQSLGFEQTFNFSAFEANEMVNKAGFRINLIFNGARPAEQENILLDRPIKYPGVTHVAFIVCDVYAFKDWCLSQGISITEDIHPIGPRRVAMFIRDPDGNVLEFNQLIEVQR